MFNNNEFTTEYFEIVTRNKELTKGMTIREIKSSFPYTEKHHIIPKSLGGNNKNENIVYLPAADHYRCHILLTKMTYGSALGKMWCGLWRMMNKQSKSQQRDYIVSPEDYELARSNFAKEQQTRMAGKNNPFYGQTHSANTRSLMSQKKKGKTYEEIYGVEKAAEMRQRRAKESSSKKKGKQELITCKFCGKVGGGWVMNRWHNKNCKSNTTYNTDVDVT